MKPLRILVAEDNEADVILLREALTHHAVEHELHIVANGQAALYYISQMGHAGGPSCPDVLLLDLNLPKADGTTILEEFRKHPECTETPVIVVTSSNAERDRVKVAAYRVARYFQKPSDFDAFMELGAIVRQAALNCQAD